MTWVNEYQSSRCCEFSELCTAPCQSLTLPQLQIGVRPIAQSASACSARIAGTARTSVHGGIRRGNGGGAPGGGKGGGARKRKRPRRRGRAGGGGPAAGSPR